MLENILIIKIVNVEKVEKFSEDTYIIVEKCSEYIGGNEMNCNETLNDYKKVCNSCRIYIVFLVIGISSAYFYYYWYLKRSDTNINTGFYTVNV